MITVEGDDRVRDPASHSWWSLLIGLYGYALPGFLYAAWLTIRSGI
jgi:hypothetical protein